MPKIKCFESGWQKECLESQIDSFVSQIGCFESYIVVDVFHLFNVLPIGECDISSRDFSVLRLFTFFLQSISIGSKNFVSISQIVKSQWFHLYAQSEFLNVLSNYLGEQMLRYTGCI